MYELYAVRFEWRPLWSDRAACRASLQSAPGRRQRPDPTTRWAHGHPSSCRLRRTDRVVGLGPKRRHSPPGSGGVTPRSRCRRCERVAEPKVRIRSLQRRVGGSHRPGRCRSRTVAFARLCAARLAAPSAEERLALVQPGIVVLGQVRVCDSQWARMLILCARAESTGSAKQAADAGPFTWAGRSRSASKTSR